MAPDTPLYLSYTILYCTVLYCILCTVFVPPFTTGVLSPFHYFVLYLYQSLYCICTIFISLSCTVFVLPVYLYHYFVLCLYHSLYCVCSVFVSQSTTGVLSPFHRRVFKLPVRLPIHQSVRWPLSPFLARLVLLGSLTATAIRRSVFNFALGLLKVQRRHNVYRLL